MNQKWFLGRLDFLLYLNYLEIKNNSILQSDNSLIKRTWKMTLKKVSGKSAKNNEKVLFKLYIWGNTCLNAAILFSCPLVFFSSIKHPFSHSFFFQGSLLDLSISLFSKQVVVEVILVIILNYCNIIKYWKDVGSK